MVKMMLLRKGGAVSRFSRRKGTINTIYHNISSDDDVPVQESRPPTSNEEDIWYCIQLRLRFINFLKKHI